MFDYKSFKKSVARKTRKYRKVKIKAKPDDLKQRNYNPLLPYKLVLHTGERQMAISHVSLWLDSFSKAGVPYVVVTRNDLAYAKVSRVFPDIALVMTATESVVNRFIRSTPSLKACFYPSNTGNNIHFLNNNHIQHIFIGHGDSDKSGSAHKFFRAYDYNWVAGEAHYDRFANAGFDFPNLKFRYVGRPSLKQILLSAKAPWQNRYDKLRILILPTWEGVYEEQNYASLSFIEDTVNMLSKEVDAEIAVKLHPATGSRLTKLRDMAENLHNCTVHSSDKPVSELLMENNLFVCDISAVVSEALAASAPIFLYMPDDRKIKISKSKMIYSDYCYIHNNPSQLVQNIRDVTNGGDTLQDARNKAKEYVLGSKATLNEEFLNELVNISQGGSE